MSLEVQDLIKKLERAEALFKAYHYGPLQEIITNLQEDIEMLSDKYPAVNARYYRIYMLYIGVYEELNMTAMESYLQALISIGQELPSDYEHVCSYYKECSEWIFTTALMTNPYNETLHLFYALKLQAEKRYDEAILTLKYILECYPALTEACFLLWEIEAAHLEVLCHSNDEEDCNEILELASATHNTTVLKGLEIEDRLDQTSKNLAAIQVALWEGKASENKKRWISEWRHLELNNNTRILLADYAKSFMMYDMVSQLISAPEEPQFPEENYINFSEYEQYMEALVNSGWQLAQHQYLLLGNSSYYYSKNNTTIEICVERGLALNPKNPLLLVLKSNYFLLEQNYNESGAAQHEAFKNGLRMSEYLFNLLTINSRIESWQGILDIVVQFHSRQTPTLKTLFFQARALVKLGRYEEALTVINEALSDYPLPPHSYAPWLYNLRMVIHKINHNYTAFFEDMQSEINFYQDGDSDYFNTMNMCIEALLEMKNYEECHKYAIYNFEQGYLLDELKPVFQWICYQTFLETPEALGEAKAEDLIDTPKTFEEYRNNGFIQWMLDDYTAGAASLKMAAELSTNKAFYITLALECLTYGTNNNAVIQLCETIKREVPEARNWKVDYNYANAFQQEKRYKESLVANYDVMQRYTEYTFFNFEKDDYHIMLKTVKEATKGLENIEEFTKYNAMFLSKDNPSEMAMLEHLELAQTHYKEAIFLQHNLLETISKLDVKLEDNILETLNSVKSKIRTQYFA
ncbi:hypothetical protein FNB79_11110 [Formosa sediminum]|uniref:Tetratricopeptide repeat protein n=1 Tax=Formosa sediminum TaxID=2594004 RepID=A0A516GSY1_9FLAO|nr:hypothetical protein [Formosa sediminum]QDO94490.1 hypothetical protein FNB79_11110 [Formosa sediminum]